MTKPETLQLTILEGIPAPDGPQGGAALGAPGVLGQGAEPEPMTNCYIYYNVFIKPSFLYSYCFISYYI